MEKRYVRNKQESSPRITQVPAATNMGSGQDYSTVEYCGKETSWGLLYRWAKAGVELGLLAELGTNLSLVIQMKAHPNRSSAHESSREVPRLEYFRGWAAGEDAQCLKAAVRPARGAPQPEGSAARPSGQLSLQHRGQRAASTAPRLRLRLPAPLLRPRSPLPPAPLPAPPGPAPPGPSPRYPRPRSPNSAPPAPRPLSPAPIPECPDLTPTSGSGPRVPRPHFARTPHPRFLAPLPRYPGPAPPQELSPLPRLAARPAPFPLAPLSAPSSLLPASCSSLYTLLPPAPLPAPPTPCPPVRAAGNMRGRPRAAAGEAAVPARMPPFSCPRPLQATR
ncbi:uncharacterized protein LOC135988727 [Caloenas nicobarica]|uniref:uncharacterized protein LOC135988727 n=1 Tax=Caloenas nicobarica TaxID=187106 RepID=UPI0032B79BF3